jgi:predicted small lipoprotein YifL
MKKSLLMIIIIMLLTMTGCGDKGEFASFIPTPSPESEDTKDEDPAAEDVEEDTEDNNTESTLEGTPTPKPLHVGQTTTMYVKLDKYDAILNVRATPSKDGNIVGFLVHTEKIEVIEIVDGWASFAQSGEVHYVSADFLVNERPDYIEPPIPSKAPTKKPTPTNKPVQESTPAQDSTSDTDMDEAPPEI